MKGVKKINLSFKALKVENVCCTSPNIHLRYTITFLQISSL